MASPLPSFTCTAWHRPGQLQTGEDCAATAACALQMDSPPGGLYGTAVGSPLRAMTKKGDSADLSDNLAMSMETSSLSARDEDEQTSGLLAAGHRNTSISSSTALLLPTLPTLLGQYCVPGVDGGVAGASQAPGQPQPQPQPPLLHVPLPLPLPGSVSVALSLPLLLQPPASSMLHGIAPILPAEPGLSTSIAAVVAAGPLGPVVQSSTLPPWFAPHGHGLGLQPSLPVLQPLLPGADEHGLPGHVPATTLPPGLHAPLHGYPL